MEAILRLQNVSSSCPFSRSLNRSSSRFFSPDLSSKSLVVANLTYSVVFSFWLSYKDCLVEFKLFRASSYVSYRALKGKKCSGLIGS